MLIVEKFCNPFVDQTIWRDSYPFGGRAFVTCLLSYLLYDKAVCRNAQAAAGLLNMWEWVHMNGSDQSASSHSFVTG